MKTRMSHKVLSYVGFPLFIAAILALLWLFRGDFYRIFASPARLRDWVRGWGYVAPLVFIALQFLQVVLFVIPGEVAQIAGGYIFGMWLGILYSLVGILLGSLFNFFLARLLGLPFVRAVFGESRLERFDTVLTSPRATIAFFVLFLIPGVPKDALCYIAGLSTIRLSLFMLVSTVGRLPGIVGSSALGGAAAERMWATVVSIAIAAGVLFVVGLFYRERLQLAVDRIVARRERRAPDGTAAEEEEEHRRPRGGAPEARDGGDEADEGPIDRRL